MSDAQSNVFNYNKNLTNNCVATAAALDLVGKACSAGDDTNKVGLIEWISEGDSLVKLRNAIKESASGE